MKREFRFAEAFELRQESGAKLPKIVGYAAVFNVLSEPLYGFRERILPGAFQDSLKNDVRALVDHDSSMIIGRSKSKTLIMREDKKGLYVEITPPDTSLGRDLVESIRRGDLDQMSFGFRTIEDNWKTEEGQTVRELVKADVFDVSIVAFPAYPQTSADVRSLFPDGLPEECEKRTKAPEPIDPVRRSAARKRLDELEQEFGIKH